MFEPVVNPSIALSANDEEIIPVLEKSPPTPAIEVVTLLKLERVFPAASLNPSMSLTCSSLSTPVPIGSRTNSAAFPLAVKTLNVFDSKLMALSASAAEMVGGVSVAALLYANAPTSSFPS